MTDPEVMSEIEELQSEVRDLRDGMQRIFDARDLFDKTEGADWGILIEAIDDERTTDGT